jgi:hypothetical protein
MNQNRYEPPHAPLNPRSREPGSIPKAVVVGALVDIGGTMIGGLVIGICYSVVMGLQGHSSDEIQRALSSFDTWSTLGIILTLMGILMSGLGGYQCAVIANRQGYLAPGILSLVSTTFGALMNDGERLPLTQLLLMSGITVAAILIGASLHTRKLGPVPQPRTPQ